MTEDQITQIAREEAAAAARERGWEGAARDHLAGHYGGSPAMIALRARIRRDAERPTYDPATETVVTRVTEAEALVKARAFVTDWVRDKSDRHGVESATVRAYRSLGIIADPTPIEQLAAEYGMTVADAEAFLAKARELGL